mmetsp:Transcript_1512/g.2267  ORF Transcript_1512/g.2267 Transcript_1512/m.2267 type:complete len:313 (-) Transcript_1512:325-1263(-)
MDDQWSAPRSTDLLDRLSVLRKKEELPEYQCSHWSHSICQQDKDTTKRDLLREKVCDWQYKVADRCNLDREIVSISMSYLERFSFMTFSKTGKSLSSENYQLAAMTSLSIAMKLFDPKTMQSTCITSLSGGRFNKENVAEMETAILTFLSWHLIPATPLEFVRSFIRILFSPAENQTEIFDEALLNHVFEMSRFLTELSVWDDFLVKQKPSAVAFASIMITVDSVDLLCLSHEVRGGFLKCVEDSIGLTRECENVVVAERKIREVYLKCAGDCPIKMEPFVDDNIPHEASSPNSHSSRNSDSPDCVGSFFHA